MKSSIKCLILAVWIFTQTPLLWAQTEKDNEGETMRITMMTYNLKFASPTFEPPWGVRKEWQVDLIRTYKPDILGTQEGLKEQIDYLADQLPEYVVVGEGRKGGDDDEHMAIFIKRDMFRLRELNSFQLSETPEIIGSGPQVNPRMVTWVRLALINRPGKGEESPYPQNYRGHWENSQEIYVFNTHYFNSREQGLARLNASRLILERIRALDRFGEWTTERPVFLMGDFNCRPGSPPYKVLVGDEDADGTDLLRDTSKDHDDIDWILYKGAFRVIKYEEVDYQVDGKYPSDHKPIFVEFEMLKH
jgi:endonuclease/exonuclease/phosphatase family metal-dependent hydrolase